RRSAYPCGASSGNGQFTASANPAIDAAEALAVRVRQSAQLARIQGSYAFNLDTTPDRSTPEAYRRLAGGRVRAERSEGRTPPPVADVLPPIAPRRACRIPGSSFDERSRRNPAHPIGVLSNY